jgi:hypothetical protein
MTEATPDNPRAPIGSIVLLVFLYLPWLRYWFGSRPVQDGDADLEFPGGIILVFFSFIYLVVAISLSVYLYRRRRSSKAHTVAFFASLGVLALLSTLIWLAP